MRSLDALERFVGVLPRVCLGPLPTPLVRLERLSRRLGIDLWLKRDDCTGLGLGGNKSRKLEFILADAVAAGHDTVVTAGPLTSNHTMMTAAAARRLGLRVHCVLGGRQPARLTGNVRLLDYLGAALHFAPLDFSQPDPAGLSAFKATCREVVTSTQGYWIPGGGTMHQAQPAYMNAIAEIARQRGCRFDFDDLVLAFGTGSTTTGILLGLAHAGFEARVLAISSSPRWVIEELYRRPPPAHYFLESARHFGLDLSAEAIPDHEIVFGFAEEGYGVASVGADRAMRTLASEEGYLLDPVYTGKAMHGLIEMVADGRIAQHRRVLFLHTGGLAMTPVAGGHSGCSPSGEVGSPARIRDDRPSALPE